MSTTVTETYTVSDIEKVMRNLKTDLIMIADSTKAITRSQAADYASDFEALSKKGYLEFVDLTLFSAGTEVNAARYTVDTEAGGLVASRPGGVLWPSVASPFLQIVIAYTDNFHKLTNEEKKATRDQLKIHWTPSYANISHSSLQSIEGRNYVSNSYGVSRKDYSS